MDERRAELSAVAAGGADAGPVAVRWEALGPAVAARLAPSLDAVVDDVVAAVVRRDVPPEWIVGSPNARHGVEHGVRGLLALIARGPEERLPGRGLYVGFGRGQLRAGRSLAGLLAAYHHAARETWHAIARADGAAVLPQETLHALGDAILACLAEISAASAEGFAGEQAARGGDRDAARRRLLALLLRGAPPPPELARLCAAAGWQPPARVAALAFARTEPGALATRLPPDALVGALEDGCCWALLPDPDGPGRAPALQRRLSGLRAALGPTVELAQAAESARWARLALALARDRPPALVVADDHRVDLLLSAAPALAARLERTALAPLAGLPPTTRERLLETLEAWLRHRGAASPAAAELHVHAQTVRYRVGRLRALLGARLDEPEGRLELELALRARRLSLDPPRISR